MGQQERGDHFYGNFRANLANLAGRFRNFSKFRGGAPPLNLEKFLEGEL